MLKKNDYVALSAFRSQLAHFLRFSDRAARAAGITPTQYLLLLHLRGFKDRDWASIGELAQCLRASPHGTGALITRCETLGLVRRQRNERDARLVEVHLTARGRERVEQVAARNHGELRSLRNVFRVNNVS